MIRRLGRYELLEQVGSGGMAVVYRGRDTALDREVAVKLLHPHLAGSAESRARFSREARAVARLSHPSIVEIHDYSGDGAAEAFLVTEFVRGRTLRAFVGEVGVGFPEVGMLMGRALCEALVHAHSAGVIHRDLKPENVLVQEGARPALKLADFGIARILASDDRMTMTGALVGSPHHMAPEIVEGREADARSDLFSLGTILYWLATGRLPFAAGNPTAILRRSVEGDFEDPREVEPRVSPRLAALLRRCLSVDPAGRPGSAAEVREELDGVLAEVGLRDPAAELEAFLGNPPAFKEASLARAVAALTALGDRALAERAAARALSLFDRVLALEPGNSAVALRLRALSRRRRLRRAAALGALAACAVGLVLAGVAAWRARPPAPPAAPPEPASTTAALESAPRPGAGPGGASGDAPRPAEAPLGGAPVEEARPQSPPAEAAGRPGGVAAADRSARPAAGPPVELQVHVRPYAQHAFLDGVEVATGAQVVRLSIAPGRSHRLRLEHPCCAPFERQFTAQEVADLGELRVPLEPRPARLRVEGDPATRVLVGGRLIGTAGESQRAPLPVAVPAGGESPYEGPARIELEPPGAAARAVQVKLRAGSDLTLAVPAAEANP